MEKYERLAHAIQTGVAYELEKDPSSATPKHLRVGINLRACDHAALAHLLIAKGIITTEEYEEALVEELHREVSRYEARIAALYGANKITLG